MSAGTDLIERLRALLFRKQQDSDLDEELRFHVERETAERVRAGVAPTAARRAALVAFGGLEQVKEGVREARGTEPLQHLDADVRYALRGLGRNPGFAAAVIAVLGIAIGAATAVFAVADGVLLSNLPYPEPDRLVRIYQRNSIANLWSLSTVDIQALQEQQTSFSAFGAAQIGEAALSGAGRPEHVVIGRATAGFFGALDITPAYGRLIEPQDEGAGAPPVTVVSYQLAERLLGGAAAATGKSITIDGVSHSVVGVLDVGRNDLAGMGAVAWPALQLTTPTRRGPFWMRGVGRLKPGVTLEASARDLAAISERLFPIWQSGFQDRTARLTPIPLRVAMTGNAGQQVWLFAGAVALVLLIAIANVATLLLVRASARQHELLVRAALGASRYRLARLIVSECAVLTVLGGGLALLLSGVGLRLVGSLAPNLPRLSEVAFNARVMAFGVVVTLLSGLLVSISPVSAALAGRKATAKPEDRRGGTSRHANRTRGVLVTTEFALALPLLLGAGLLLNSFLRLQQVDPGFDPRGAVAVKLSLPVIRYPDNVTLQAFWRQTLQRAVLLPGVTAVGLTNALPPDNGGDVNNFNLVDHPVPEGSAEPVAPWMTATAGAFPALGVPLLAGRLFTDADTGDAPAVVVVSHAWAEHYFPRENPVGRQLISGGCYTCPRTTIVGVVGDVKYLGIAGTGEAAYDPLAETTFRSMHLVVRTTASPAATLAALREMINALDSDLPVIESTLQEQIDTSLADPLRWTTVVGGFAVAAALLAALGIFGLMSYVVRQRRRELGVRLALGAEPASLTRLIVGRGMRHALLGTAIGLGLAALEARWLGALLFDVRPMDPLTITLAALVLLAIALLACWVPGLRAARIRPAEALQSTD